MKSDVLSAFRGHRHDVLNAMQVVRGYIQLGRTQDAVAAIDRLTAWLRSLSLIQSVVTTNYRWLTVAAYCPHVILSDCSSNDAINDETDSLLADIWRWLNEEMSLVGIRELLAAVRIPQDHGNPGWDGMAICSLDARANPDIVAWWEGISEEASYRRFLHIIREE